MCKEKGGFFAEVKGGEKASFSPARPSSSFLPFYSFFLSVLVIFVHSTHFTVPALQAVPKTDFFSTSFLIKMEYFFSEFLGQIAVPGFFFLSGFLFLKGLYDLKDWARKWKSRVFSYIVPYLIWNTVMTLLYLFFGKAEWSLKSIAEGIFLYRFNPVFWYFYQLILLSFCFPFMAIFAIFIRKGEEQKGYRKKCLRHLLFLFPLFFLFLIYFQLDIPFLNEDAAKYYQCLREYSPKCRPGRCTEYSPGYHSSRCSECRLYLYLHFPYFSSYKLCFLTQSGFFSWLLFCIASVWLFVSFFFLG